MNGRRIASIAGTTAVTLIAAAGSYDHMRTLSLAAGQPGPLAAVLPLSVDGLALVATVALGDGRARRGSAWVALILAAGVSLAANVLAAGPTALDRCVSAWPSVALLACVEVLARAGRGQSVATVDSQAPQPLAANDSGRVAVAEVDHLNAQPSTALPSTALNRPTAAPGRPVAAPVAANGRPTAARTVANGTAAKVAAVVAAEPHLSTGELADRLGISARSARRYRSATVAA